VHAFGTNWTSPPETHEREPKWTSSPETHERGPNWTSPPETQKHEPAGGYGGSEGGSGEILW